MLDRDAIARALDKTRPGSSRGGGTWAPLRVAGGGARRRRDPARRPESPDGSVASSTMSTDSADVDGRALVRDLRRRARAEVRRAREGEGRNGRNGPGETVPGVSHRAHAAAKAPPIPAMDVVKPRMTTPAAWPPPPPPKPPPDESKARAEAAVARARRRDPLHPLRGWRSEKNESRREPPLKLDVEQRKAVRALVDATALERAAKELENAPSPPHYVDDSMTRRRAPSVTIAPPPRADVDLELEELLRESTVDRAPGPGAYLGVEDASNATRKRAPASSFGEHPPTEKRHAVRRDLADGPLASKIDADAAWEEPNGAKARKVKGSVAFWKAPPRVTTAEAARAAAAAEAADAEAAEIAAAAADALELEMNAANGDDETAPWDEDMVDAAVAAAMKKAKEIVRAKRRADGGDAKRDVIEPRVVGGAWARATDRKDRANAAAAAADDDDSWMDAAIRESYAMAADPAASWTRAVAPSKPSWGFLKARSISHWSPYDGVRVVHAVP